MRTPGFWQPGKGGILAGLLAPLGWAYGFATRTKLATTKPWISPVPVLCVGNLIAGGAGKTPVALDLGRRLLAKGKVIHFLSRGYGGSEKGPLRVDPEHHDYTQVGDEPLLLATLAPTWVSADRRAGCRAAADAGAQIIIMDDGFQNPYIARNFSLIVVDGSFGFGNGKLIPAGPLRESIPDGMSRADGAVVMGEDTTGATNIISQSGLTPLLARLVPAPLPKDVTGAKVIAFTGIGRPDKFFDTVLNMDCSVVSTLPFPDHHPYSNTDIASLRAAAAKAGARLLTTQKDARRLPAPFLDEVTVITIDLEWEDENAIDALLGGIAHA